MTLDFLPTAPRNRDITPHLIRALTSCYSVEGSVAFWTLGLKALNGKLLEALSRSGSSFYVDMQYPTSFQNLAQFANKIGKKRSSTAFYICLRKTIAATNRSDIVSLLHTKILLFNMGNRQWEIWIGSHNFTEKALQGKNLEASIRITGHSDEKQFKDILAQTQQYLTYIRSHCEPFDPTKITFYETMRGDIDTEGLKNRFRQELEARIIVEEVIIRRVLTLQSESADKLTDQTIILLGNLSEELAAIRQRNRGGSPVFLRVKDSKTEDIYTYEGRVRAFDNINNIPSSDVAFNKRRWALRTVERKGEIAVPPILMPTQDVGQQLISSSNYYVNVEVIRLVSDHELIQYYTYPETNLQKLWRLTFEEISDYEAVYTQLKSTSKLSYATSMVPVDDAEELASIRLVEWTTGFEDGVLERRIIVFGKNKLS